MKGKQCCAGFDLFFLPACAKHLGKRRAHHDEKNRPYWCKEPVWRIPCGLVEGGVVPGARFGGERAAAKADCKTESDAEHKGEYPVVHNENWLLP